MERHDFSTSRSAMEVLVSSLMSRMCNLIRLFIRSPIAAEENYYNRGTRGKLLTFEVGARGANRIALYFAGLKLFNFANFANCSRQQKFCRCDDNEQRARTRN